MQFVVIEPTGSGFFCDPRPYVAALPKLLPQLPPGAASWAAEPHHYNPWSDFCPRGLYLTDLFVNLEGVSLASVAWVAAHGGSRRTFRYVTPRSFELDVTGKENRMGDILWDEVLPHEDGCSHEVVFAGGTVRVTASDMQVSWEGTSEEPDEDGLLAYQRQK